MSMELQTTESTQGVQTRFIRNGIAGNYDIVYEMARLIRDSVRTDKGIEALAKNILITAGVNGNDLQTDNGTKAALTAIYEFTRSNVDYLLDIAGKVESLKTARQTLRDGYGDCDDLTVTLATLAGCVGFEDVRIALAKYGAKDADFSHVYCTIHQNGKRYVLDASLSNGKVNAEIKPFEVQEINVFDNINGLDGVAGAFTNARYFGRKAFKTAVGALPLLADYMPLGFAASHAFSQGAEMLGRVNGEQRSINAIGSTINGRLDSIIIRLMQSSIALDVAKAEALREAAQLSMVDLDAVDNASFAVVKKAVQNRLQFIKNFESYAAANDIPVVQLNAHLMLAAGLGVTGFLGYQVAKNYFSKRA